MKKPGDSEIFPLLLACRTKDSKKVRELIAAKVDVNEENGNGNTALLAAAMRGSSEICVLLIEAKAKVDHVNNNGDTSLSLCIWKKQLDASLILINHVKTSLDRSDKFGDTPLLDACRNGMEIIVEALLDKKANANHKNKKGSTPLALARSGGYADIIKLLAPHQPKADFFSASELDAFSLLSACREQDIGLIRSLLLSKVNVNQENHKGSTALLASAMRGSTEICKLLIGAKAAVDHINSNGDTPLSLCIWKKHIETSILLISYAKDSLDATDKFGDTPLLDACKSGMLPVVKLLLDKKADANQKNKKGDTPLYHARAGGYDEIIKLLLPYQKKEKNNLDSFPLLKAIHNNESFTVINQLLEQDGDPNQKNGNGISALIMAASRGKTDVCDLLINRHANVDYRSPNGDTAIWVSIWKLHKKTSLLLIDLAETTIDCQNDFGETPLIDACKSNMIEVIQPLVKKGANIYHKNRAGESPFSIAKDNPSLRKMLRGVSHKQEPKEVITRIKEMNISNGQNPENPETDKFELMVEWLLNGGAEFPYLYMKYYSEDYRGVHCRIDIHRDNVILFVPHKHLMTSDVAKESDIGKSIIASGVDLISTHSYLASYLLQEKHKQRSFWFPYLNILPEYYANVPIFFKEDLLLSLRGSFSLQKISDRIDTLRTEFNNIRRCVKQFNTFHLDEFIWARLVVITRIFGFNIHGKKTDGLVPYADMLNHKIPSETSWTFNDNRFGFIITCLRTYKKDDEVFDSYGRKCNHRYFVNYGFSVDNNKDNEAVIQVELPVSDPLFSLKKKHLGKRDEHRKREFQIPSNYSTKKCKQLFSFLRFVHAEKEELDEMILADGFSLDTIGPISVKNEMAVLNTISSVCKKHLEVFKHSLEYDYALLDSGKMKMYSNERNAVIMRRGEKEVLTWYIDLAAYATELFKMTKEQLRRNLEEHERKRCHKNSGLFSIYVATVIFPLVK